VAVVHVSCGRLRLANYYTRIIIKGGGGPISSGEPADSVCGEKKREKKIMLLF